MKPMWSSVIAAAVLAVVAGGAALLLPNLTARTERPLPVLPGAESVVVTHLPFGPVRPPRDIPDLGVTLDNGSAQQLPAVLRGHWTLVQLMFTGCSTTCPVQGAIFQQTQGQLGGMAAKVRLLSISIDPLGDTPDALAAWLKQYGSGPDWRAVVPSVDGLTPLLDVLNGRGEGDNVDVHNARVYLISPQGQLVFITEEMPSPKSLLALLSDALRSQQ